MAIGVNFHMTSQAGKVVVALEVAAALAPIINHRVHLASLNRRTHLAEAVGVKKPRVNSLHKANVAMAIGVTFHMTFPPDKLVAAVLAPAVNLKVHLVEGLVSQLALVTALRLEACHPARLVSAQALRLVAHGGKLLSILMSRREAFKSYCT